MSEPNGNSLGDAADEERIANAIEVLRAVPRMELQARGLHLEPRHFYSSANDLKFLRENRDLWHGRPLPQGVNWDLDRQVDLLSRLAVSFAELADVPMSSDPASGHGFHWDNPFWRDADAFVQYAMLRWSKPRRVVEIGCGWSSLLLDRALARNAGEGAGGEVVHQIEPFFRPEIRELLPADWTRHEVGLQRAPLSLFESLEAGDVCFYDGSHVARTASDVVWFFSEVLPRLAPGVIVHVHDIFWPDDYPDEWIFERGQTWNEQYVLHAFLMFNEAFEMLLCNSALFAMRRKAVVDLYRDTVANGHGCSVWLQRR